MDRGGRSRPTDHVSHGFGLERKWIAEGKMIPNGGFYIFEKALRLKIAKQTGMGFYSAKIIVKTEAWLMVLSCRLSKPRGKTTQTHKPCERDNDSVGQVDWYPLKPADFVFGRELLDYVKAMQAISVMQSLLCAVMKPIGFELQDGTGGFGGGESGRVLKHLITQPGRKTNNDHRYKSE